MTSNQERQFEGVWIPKEIYLSKKLTPTEKLLLAEIRSFSKNGVCFASNEHFSEFLGISKGHVSKLVTKLKNMGFITVQLTYKDNTKEVEKRIITPVFIHEYTPTPERVDPLGADEYTSTHLGVDPLGVDEQEKEQEKEQIKVQKKIKNKKSDSPELRSEFESLWDKYPRKIGKSKALQSFIKARKVKKYTFEEIENGLNKYIDYITFHETEEQFIQHGSTWFNQEKWLDDYVCRVTKKESDNVFDFMRKEYGGLSNDRSGDSEIIDHDTRSLFESQL